MWRRHGVIHSESIVGFDLLDVAFVAEERQGAFRLVHLAAIADNQFFNRRTLINAYRRNIGAENFFTEHVVYDKLANIATRLNPYKQPDVGRGLAGGFGSARTRYIPYRD